MIRSNPNRAEQPADFVDAHQRHWEDGNLLCDHDRWANAAYLLGFSAECGLKAAMQVLKWMPLDAMGTPRERKHRQHIQAIWPLFADLASDQFGARYGLAPGNPFHDWSHHDRYANRGHVGPEEVHRYRKATREVVRIMRLAEVDGIV